MKLSTKKLFSTLKSTPKRKPKIIHKPKSSHFVEQYNISNNNNYFSNSNLKQKLFETGNIPKENPFKKPVIHYSRLKNIKFNKIINSSKKLGIESLKTNDLFEDSDINNELLTSESESNRYEPIFEKENKDINNFEQHIDILCNIFRKSSLKSTIIIDNKGNNNLDSEQKKIIETYFNEKNKNSSFKNKINTIPLQKYNKNQNVFKHKYTLIDGIKCNNNFDENIKKKLNFNTETRKVKNKKKIKNNFFHNKLLSTRVNTKKNIEEDLFDIMSKKEKYQTDGNSVFENLTNKSIDSSFLGSSLDDDFYKGLANKKT